MVLVTLRASVKGGQLLCPAFLLQGIEPQMSEKLLLVLDTSQRIKLM